MNINSNKYNWWTLLLVACAILSACEKQPASTQNAISFGSGRKQAPSTINANARLWGYTTGTNGYWVFAGATTDGLTEGADAEYTKNESTGTLTPGVTRYWADNQTYNFYSVWPVVTTGNGISDIAFDKANSQLSFTADISNQNDNTDFCIAAALDEEGGADRNTAVQMTYKHALSKVQFYGFSSTANIEAQLTKFTIRVPKSATAVCTLEEDTKERTTKNDVTTEYPLTITYTFVDSDDNTTNGVDSINLASTLPEDLPEGQDYFSLNVHDATTNPNGTQVLEKLVLPMQQGGTFHVAATYKIGNNTKTVETDITATWQPGKNYIYKFKIQPAGPIIFADEVIINDWDEEIPAGDVQF